MSYRSELLALANELGIDDEEAGESQWASYLTDSQLREAILRLRPDASIPSGDICGCRVQHDASGQGHAWRNVNASEIPANIVEEIAAEILDGGKDECDDYVASNGLHYRWA